ncbi:MAG: TIGR01777 family protein [Saprospiraceae bacterium]|nr:TIGR01777 family protein [Saprospiraceae bacterium]
MSGTVKKKILIAGGTGLVGKAFTASIDRDKYEIYVLTRGKSGDRDGIHYIQWNPDDYFYTESIPAEIIINLAGAGIADARWTDARKKILVDSRVKSAATIMKMIEASGSRPEVYISASAVGYYGDRSDNWLNEDSEAGAGFMADCCVQWEEAATATGKHASRTVILRIGLVLSLKGGALPKMLMTAPLRIFNYFGNGRQYYPWIHIHDLVNMLHFAIENTALSGIYNAVAPHPVTNKQMVESIASLYTGFKLILPAPAFALQILLGEMSRVVLNSNRVSAAKILEAGYRFSYEKIGDALKNLLAVK